MLVSPYLHGAVIITALCYGLWSKPDWWETFLTINPAILGFTIGGFALLLATGGEKFGAVIAQARLYEKNALESPLAKLGAAFVHFIIVQFLSIIYAIIAKSADKVPPPHGLDFLSSRYVHLVFWGVGFFVGVYALVSAIAASEWIFRIVILLVKFHKGRFRIEKKRQDEGADGQDPSDTGQV